VESQLARPTHPDIGTRTARGLALRWLAAFMNLDFRKAIWLAPLAWTLHEAEEWNINEFESQHFVDPGYFSLIDHPVLWLGLAQVALHGVLWTALTAWPKNPRFAAFLTLPYFIYIPFGNVGAHLYWVFLFGSYTPGILTAVLLVAPVVLGLTIKAVRERLIPWWYAAILYLLPIPALISTIQSADHISPWMQAAQQNGIHIARIILGREP
jgi:hypothetical protein